MGFNLVYWTTICGIYSLGGSILEKIWGKNGKTAVFPGAYSRIWEMTHGRLWPDWGLKG